jgi:hypothetical protein
MEKQPDQGGDNQERDRHSAERKQVQRFQFGVWRFNIDRAQALITEQPRETQPLPVAAWARYYGLDHAEDRHSISLIGPGPDFDRSYAMTTDLTEPVIVATLHSKEHDEDYPLLIDGTHRLYRAHQEGVAVLPAYVLDVTETLAIREDRIYR